MQIGLIDSVISSKGRESKTTVEDVNQIVLRNKFIGKHQGILESCSCNISTISVDESMVGKSIQGWARTSNVVSTRSNVTVLSCGY